MAGLEADELHFVEGSPSWAGWGFEDISGIVMSADGPLAGDSIEVLGYFASLLARHGGPSVGDGLKVRDSPLVGPKQVIREKRLAVDPGAFVEWARGAVVSSSVWMTDGPLRFRASATPGDKRVDPTWSATISLAGSGRADLSREFLRVVTGAGEVYGAARLGTIWFDGCGQNLRDLPLRLHGYGPAVVIPERSLISEPTSELVEVEHLGAGRVAMGARRGSDVVAAVGEIRRAMWPPRRMGFVYGEIEQGNLILEGPPVATVALSSALPDYLWMVYDARASGLIEDQAVPNTFEVPREPEKPLQTRLRVAKSMMAGWERCAQALDGASSDQTAEMWSLSVNGDDIEIRTSGCSSAAGDLLRRLLNPPSWEVIMRLQ